ncbi:MAG: response regulator [Pirellulaceae bacterium]
MDDGPIHVLLIEDDEDDYLLTKELFGELPVGGYQLDRVADYAAAIHAFEHCSHDLYLVDYRLGQHTGLELLGAARLMGCHSPMIVLTGQRDRAIDLLAMKAGAADYLVKGQLDAGTLDRSLRYAVQKKRHEETIRQVNQQLEQRVELRTSELEHLNATLQAEIAERRRVEDALREADRRKDEFLATLAHELRNPLAPLASAIELNQLEPDNGGQVRELAGMMGRQLRRLVRLIDDLLDVSRVSSGKLRLQREAIAMADVVQAALDMGRPVIEAAGHQLSVALSPELLFIEGDQVRLSQVISNLLINAAKYTPPGGQIELESRRDADQVVVCVRDTGIGIPAEMLSQIFELFAQVDTSATRAFGGLGIGLTLAKTLVEMHRGTIHVQSAGPGLGSEFTVRFPLVTRAADGENVDAVADGRRQALPVLRILVVDDNQSAAHLLSRLLGKLGQQVIMAYAAGEAFDAVRRERPDLVISDIAMPHVSGYDFAQQIRALKDIRQPVLIALTGYGQESDRQQALAAGFDHHLIKPISLQELEELLRLLARHPNTWPR